MKQLRYLMILTVVAVASVALAACGSDSDSTSAGDTGASTTEATTETAKSEEGPEEKATGTAYKVGVIASFSGSQSSVTSLLPASFEAWEQTVNSSGGIDGHPVEVVMKDDEEVPAKGIAAAKELVADKVIAILGDNSLVDTAWEKYVSDAGIPVIGGSPYLGPFSSNPDWFTVGSGLAVNTVGSFKLAKEEGKTKAGVLYCAEVAVCAQLVDLGKVAGETVGGFEVTGQSVSATAPDFTPTCLAMRSKGVDTLFLGLNAAIVPRVVDACVAQGYEPYFTTNTSTVANYWLDDENMNGFVTIAPIANYADASIPAVKEFQEALDKYAPGQREEDGYGITNMYPWAAGKMFEAAIEGGKVKAPGTAEEVKKGLYSLNEETLDGLIPPVTYEEGKTAFPTCYFVVAIENDEITSPEGTEPQCLSAAEEKSLKTALKIE